MTFSIDIKQYLLPQYVICSGKLPSLYHNYRQCRYLSPVLNFRMVGLETVFITGANAQKHLARFAPVDSFTSLWQVKFLSFWICSLRLIILLGTDCTSVVRRCSFWSLGYQNVFRVGIQQQLSDLFSCKSLPFSSSFGPITSNPICATTRSFAWRLFGLLPAAFCRRRPTWFSLWHGQNIQNLRLTRFHFHPL